MIDTKLLRQKLIDMAMRGQLVEQRPEEGNASDLLEQIRAEKAELIKEGKIKKEKPLPEIEEDEKPFAIPANWCWVRLGEIVEVNPRNSLNDELKVGFMPMTMLEGGFNNHHFYEVRPWGDVKSGFTHLKNGDLAIAKITPCFQNRKSAIIKGFPNEYGAGTTEVSVLRDSTGLVNIKYLLWIAKSERFINSGTASFSGSVGQQRIHKDFLATYSIPLPPLAEQKRIVVALEASLKLIDTIAQDSADLDKALKFLRQKLLDMAMRGQLVEQCPEDGNATDLLEQIRAEKAALIKAGKIKKEKPLPEIKEEEKPFAIPDSWCWVRLGEIGYTNIGLTYSPNDLTKDGTIVLRSGNIQNGKIDYKDIVKVDIDIPANKMCCVGDILICARNGSKRLVGKTALVDKEGLSFGAFMAIFRSNYNSYVINLLRSSYFRDSVLGGTSTSTTTVNQLTQDMIKNVLVPLPPLAEQKRIVAKLEQINALIDTMLN